MHYTHPIAFLFVVITFIVVTFIGSKIANEHPPRWFIVWILLLIIVAFFGLSCASFQNHVVPIGQRPQAKVVNHANFRVTVEVTSEFGTRRIGSVLPGDSTILLVPFGDVPLTVNFYGPNDIWVATYKAEPLDDMYEHEWRWVIEPKQ